MISLSVILLYNYRLWNCLHVSLRGRAGTFRYQVSNLIFFFLHLSTSFSGCKDILHRSVAMQRPRTLFLQSHFTLALEVVCRCRGVTKATQDEKHKMIQTKRQILSDSLLTCYVSKSKLDYFSFQKTLRFSQKI